MSMESFERWLAPLLTKLFPSVVTYGAERVRVLLADGLVGKSFCI